MNTKIKKPLKQKLKLKYNKLVLLLRAKRVENNISQRKCSELSGLHLCTIEKIEQTGQISYQTLLDYAAGCGVNNLLDDYELYIQIMSVAHRKFIDPNFYRYTIFKNTSFYVFKKLKTEFLTKTRVEITEPAFFYQIKNEQNKLIATKYYKVHVKNCTINIKVKKDDLNGPLLTSVVNLKKQRA